MPFPIFIIQIEIGVDPFLDVMKNKGNIFYFSRKIPVL